MRFKFAQPSNRTMTLAMLALVWLVCGAYLAWLFQPLGVWLTYPLAYEGDGLWNIFVIKTILETGWYGGNPYLGAPYSAAFFDFAKPETLYLLMYRLGGAFTDNAVLLHNLFYFSGFFLVAGSALLALRGGFQLSWPLASAGAVIYTFLPFHFLRIWHLFLSDYFTAPIAVWLALLVSSERPPFFPEGRLGAAKWPVLLAMAVVASTSIYYAFFALCIIFAIGACEALRVRLWRHFLSGALVCALISAIVAANLAPSLLYRAKNGVNLQVAARTVSELDPVALRPVMLLLPISDHRFPLFAKLALSYKDSPLFNGETRSSYLGILGGLGFLLLLAALFSGHRIAQALPRFGFASRINIIALSLAVCGGGGLIIGLAVNPQFRSLNRISVFIAFVSIAGLMLVLDHLLAARPRKGLLTAVAVLLAAIGLWDQTPLNARPDAEDLIARYDSDRAFVRDIESRLPAGALVLQLPYSSFPETPSRFRETFYSHLRGYLHGKKLRWSYGGMRGRSPDLWNMSLSQFPLAEQVRIARNSGFSGIWLDRMATPDNAASLEAELRALGLAGDLESADQTLVFYPLTPTGNQPADLLPPPTLEAGFFPWEGSYNKLAWSGGNARMALLNPGNKSRRARLHFTLSSLVDRPVKIALKEQTLKELVLRKNELEPVDLVLDLPPGKTRVFLATGQPPVSQSSINPNSTDPRPVAMSIRNLWLAPVE